MTSLHSLRILSCSYANPTQTSLKRPVNLLKLRELEIEPSYQWPIGILPIYSQLISTFDEAPREKLKLSLRGFGAHASLPARCLHSLDTLTSLEICGFGFSMAASDPALSENFQRAIPKQKNLRCLILGCYYPRRRAILNHVPAVLVRSFVEGLPYLREFGVAPAMGEIVRRIAIVGPIATLSP